MLIFKLFTFDNNYLHKSITLSNFQINSRAKILELINHEPKYIYIFCMHEHRERDILGFLRQFAFKGRYF